MFAQDGFGCCDGGNALAASLVFDSGHVRRGGKSEVSLNAVGLFSDTADLVLGDVSFLDREHVAG